MEFNVVNHEICVGNIKVVGVSSSSIFLVGDVQTVQLSSAFDTPPNPLLYCSLQLQQQQQLHQQLPPLLPPLHREDF